MVWMVVCVVMHTQAFAILLENAKGKHTALCDRSTFKIFKSVKEKCTASFKLWWTRRKLKLKLYPCKWSSWDTQVHTDSESGLCGYCFRDARDNKQYMPRLFCRLISCEKERWLVRLLRLWFVSCWYLGWTGYLVICWLIHLSSGLCKRSLSGRLWWKHMYGLLMRQELID